ncbi:hypothetical protein [Haloferula sp.]|uniref:hypothetical protein n=1 Tax=Haloferula sp. TaxID=2497595 RepID=UPI003C714B9D
MTVNPASWLILLGLVPLCVGLTRLMIHAAPKLGLVDTPSDRRIHTKVTPRAGGIAIYLTMMIGLGLLHLSGHTFSQRISGPGKRRFARLKTMKAEILK